MAFEITEELNRKFDERYVIVSESGCWIWTGMQREGYGRIIAKGSGKFIAAHRYSFARYNGAILQEMVICHKCDVPSCVNPEHLWLGTRAENNADRDKKRRHVRHSRGGHTRHDPEVVKAAVNSDLPLRKAAKFFGLSPGYLSVLRNGVRPLPRHRNLASAKSAPDGIRHPKPHNIGQSDKEK